MPNVPLTFYLIFFALIFTIFVVIREYRKGNKPRKLNNVYAENSNFMSRASAYHYDDSDGYTLETTENEIKVTRSDGKPSILFTLRPYQLNGQDYVFLQVNDFGEGVNLERMVIPLDNIFSALEASKFFHVIFSFKGVLFFSDLALSISISHMQRIEDNGGRIIFCDTDPGIIEVMEILGLDKITSWYTSEEEMVKMETA